MDMKTSEWEGFKRIDFFYEDRECVLIIPEKEDVKSRLAVYAEYFGAFPNIAIELLNRGYYLAFMQNENRWGTDKDQHIKFGFINYVAREYLLSNRAVFIGMSCGGLHAVNFAYLYPNNVSVLYLDAPVLNMLSCPMGYGEAKRDESVVQECCAALGMTEAEMLSFRGHPIDKMHRLVKNDIPVILVYGESDDVVPYAENGELLEKYYADNGGKIKVIGKKNCGHHPHGLENPQIIANLIDEYYR